MSNCMRSGDEYLAHDSPDTNSVMFTLLPEPATALRLLTALPVLRKSQFTWMTHISSTVFFSVVTMFGFVTEVSGTSVALAPVADSFVCSGDWSENNYGGRPFTPRAVGRQNEYTGQQIGRALYRFVLPDAVISVTSARLRIRTCTNWAGPAITAVYGAEDNWNEMTVTWNNQPAEDSALLSSVYPSEWHTSYDFDVTPYVQDQFGTGDRMISFVQRAPDENVIGGVLWWLREYNDLNGAPPRLIITPAPEPGSWVLVTCAGLALIRRSRR